MKSYFSFQLSDIKRKGFHDGTFLIFLSLLAFSLPVSFFLLSVSMIGLASNWLIEGRFGEKLNNLLRNKALLWFLLIYPVHLFWMLNTSDYTYGMHDLRIKLPLLVLPLVIGTSEGLSWKRLQVVLYAFLAGCLLANILAIFRYTGILSTNTPDVRNISGSLSHIRLALMVNMAFFITLWIAVNSHKKAVRIALYGLAVWFLLFIFFLKSLTGLVVLLVVGWILGWIETKKLESGMKKSGFYMLLILVPVIVIAYGIYVTDRFYPDTKEDFNNLPAHTANGNPYSHYINARALENGNYVWINLCVGEMRSAWDSRSTINYDSLDRTGQPIKYTLIRYLTAKGLNKDSAGVYALSVEDMRNIEGGMANPVFADRLRLYPYIYRVVWEIDNYRRGENPSGHSITQRLEYYRAAWYIIKHQPVFGTGTGDVAVSFKQAYEEMNSQLTERWRLRAHNQYLTFLLTFGLAGFLIVMAAMIVPVVLLRKHLHRIDIVFLVIAALSMINEDTLETHAGVSFVAFFTALLLFGRRKMIRDETVKKES